MPVSQAETRRGFFDPEQNCQPALLLCCSARPLQTPVELLGGTKSRDRQRAEGSFSQLLGLAVVSSVPLSREFRRVEQLTGPFSPEPALLRRWEAAASIGAVPLVLTASLWSVGLGEAFNLSLSVSPFLPTRSRCPQDLAESVPRGREKSAWQTPTPSDSLAASARPHKKVSTL